MEVRLKVVGGTRAGQEIPIPGPKFLIGRDEACDLRPKSDAVSRRHCLLQVEDGRATVLDLGSRNGTLVNDRRVEGRYTLKTGDRLTIGQLQFEVQLTTGLKGQKQPIVKNVQEAAAQTRDSAASEDLNVDEWLNSDEPAGENRRGSEDSQRSDLADTSPGMEAATIIGRADKDTGATKNPPEGGQKSSGKLPPTTTDSFSAAAEILRKMKKYR